MVAVYIDLTMGSLTGKNQQPPTKLGFYVPLSKYSVATRNICIIRCDLCETDPYLRVDFSKQNEAARKHKLAGVCLTLYSVGQRLITLRSSIP